VCALDGVLRCVANHLSNLRNADDVALFCEGDNKSVIKMRSAGSQNNTGNYGYEAKKNITMGKQAVKSLKQPKEK